MKLRGLEKVADFFQVIVIAASRRSKEDAGDVRRGGETNEGSGL